MRRICLLALTGLFTSLLSTFRAQATFADEPDPLLGSFAGDRLAIEIRRDSGADAYAGVIRLPPMAFPFTARGGGSAQLNGQFKSGADSFDFTATLVGSTLTLRTGGTTYRMARVAPATPIATSRPTTQQAPASRPAQAATAPNSQPTRAPHGETTVIYDAMMACEAATVRVPSGWKCRLDVVWRQNPYDPAAIAGTVSAPNGPARLTIYPRLSFIDGVQAGHGRSGWYMGSEVRPPIASPADYVRQIILPRFRSDVTNPRVTSEIDLRGFARDELPKFQKVPGVQVKASRVRVRYLLNGNLIEEDFVCTLGIVPLSGGMVAWGAECSSYRAARGELDPKLPLLRCIESSLHPNLPWYSGVLQVSQSMQQDVPASTIDAARLSRYISQRSADVSELAREAYDRRERVLAKCGADLDAAIGGIAGNTAPTQHSPVAIPVR